MAKHDRQLEVARNFCLPPHGGNYEVTEFEVEQWCNGRFLFVRRAYKRADLRNVGYSESFRIGPRGGVKRLTHSLIY